MWFVQLYADLTDLWRFDSTSTSGYSIDLDDLDNGVAMIRNCTNAPDDNVWWFVITICGDNNRTRFQIATRLSANTGLFKRYCSGGTWSSWMDATGANTLSLSDLNLPPIVED